MIRVWYNKSFSFVYAVINLIKQQDSAREFTLIASHTQPQARALLVADEAHVEPSGLTGAHYADWCLDFCRQQRVDVFVVGKDAQYLATQRERFEAQGTRMMLVGDSATLRLLDDKALFAEHLPADIAVLPETVSVTSAQAFDQAYHALRARHPRVCIKPAISVFGLGFRVIDEKHSCLHHILKGEEYIVGLDELKLAMSQQTEFRPLLVMEYLDGDEWSVDCVADNGRLWAAVQRKKSMHKGGVPSQLIDDNAQIAAMTERLAAHLQLSGQFNVQYRMGKNGIKLLEINARPSGGMAMACLAGVNLPYLALKGFVSGYDSLIWPQPRTGMAVGEVSVAIELPV